MIVEIIKSMLQVFVNDINPINSYLFIFSLCEIIFYYPYSVGLDRLTIICHQISTPNYRQILKNVHTEKRNYKKHTKLHS